MTTRKLVEYKWHHIIPEAMTAEMYNKSVANIMRKADVSIADIDDTKCIDW